MMSITKFYKGLFAGFIILFLLLGNYHVASAAGGSNPLTYNGAYLTTITNNVSTAGDDVTKSSNIGVKPQIELQFSLNVAGATVWSNNQGLIKLTDTNGDVVPITVWQIYNDNAAYDAEKRNIFITPVNSLTPGDTYTISIDGNLTANNGVKVTGGTQYTKFTVAADATPPVLTINQPADSTQTDQNKITVSGSTEPGSSVTINNDAVTVNADGSFSNEVTLAEGSNTITITSADRFGNKTVSTLKVTYDKPAPPSENGQSTNTDSNGGTANTTAASGTTGTVTSSGTASNETTSGTTSAPATNGTTAGEKLPNTATNMFNLLAVGILLIACGVILFFRSRKHHA